MEEEVTLLRDKIENRQTLSRAGCEIYTGQLNGVDVALLKSGIGKVSAAMGTTLLLEHCQPDIVINTGSAGGLASSLKVGDIVVSTEVRYHDADVTAFGYEPGQMAGCPAAFIADPKLIELAESCIKQLDLNAVRGGATGHLARLVTKSCHISIVIANFCRNHDITDFQARGQAPRRTGIDNNVGLAMF